MGVPASPLHNDYSELFSVALMRRLYEVLTKLIADIKKYLVVSWLNMHGATPPLHHMSSIRLVLRLSMSGITPSWFVQGRLSFY